MYHRHLRVMTIGLNIPHWSKYSPLIKKFPSEQNIPQWPKYSPLSNCRKFKIECQVFEGTLNWTFSSSQSKHFYFETMKGFRKWTSSQKQLIRLSIFIIEQQSNCRHCLPTCWLQTESFLANTLSTVFCFLFSILSLPSLLNTTHNTHSPLSFAFILYSLFTFLLLLFFLVVIFFCQHTLHCLLFSLSILSLPSLLFSSFFSLSLLL